MGRFSAKLMEYYQAPVNRGRMEESDRIGSATMHGGPLQVTIYLKLAGSQIVRATFEAAGCGVTIACAAVLTELIAGKTIQDCRELSAEQIAAALDGIPPDKSHCATVAAAALQDALGDQS